MKNRVLLVILDGFGIRKDKKSNAVLQASMPNFTGYMRKFPHCVLKASGEAVGLPNGVMGNSEVGHMNIGAGRVVAQELSRIDTAVKDKSFFGNAALLKAAGQVKRKGSALHLIGLLSDAGVHSNISHLFALLKLAKDNNVKTVFVHAITDGRDTNPDSAISYVKRLQGKLGSFKVGTVIGRYFAMDRDKRWDRTERAYNCLVNAEGLSAKDAVQAVKSAYARKETDEFVQPTVIGNYPGVKDNDAIIFFNFRSDRARQLCWALTKDDFSGFSRKKPDIGLVCMCKYADDIKADIAFPPVPPKNILSEVLSKQGVKQLRIAETEKYAHVTFFFNSQIETPFSGEDRIIVPSPKVATYDLKPEMSAYEVASKAVEAIGKKDYGFVAVNFANPDMVGHTGNVEATVKALEHVDACLGSVVDAARKKGFAVIVTADHGNCEEMLGAHKTSHTTNPVPFILISDEKTKMRNGVLGDIAPTILGIMGVNKPKEMSCKGLVA